MSKAETPVTEQATKRVQVSVYLDPEDFQKLDDYRWANRVKNNGEVLRIAVRELFNAKA